SIAPVAAVIEAIRRDDVECTSCHGQNRCGRLYQAMTTTLYSHPIYLEHLTPKGHPERPDRLRAIHRVLADERFDGLRRAEASQADPDTTLLAHPQALVDAVRAAIPQSG